MIQDASHLKGSIYCIGNVSKNAFETIIWMVIWIQDKEKLSSSQEPPTRRIINYKHLLYTTKQPISSLWSKESCTIPLWLKKILPCVIMSCPGYLVFVHVVLRLWDFDSRVVPIEVCRIIIEHVGWTLCDVTQTPLLQTTKCLLKSISSGQLELAFIMTVWWVQQHCFWACNMSHAWPRPLWPWIWFCWTGRGDMSSTALWSHQMVWIVDCEDMLVGERKSHAEESNPIGTQL